MLVLVYLFVQALNHRFIKTNLRWRLTYVRCLRVMDICIIWHAWLLSVDKIKDKTLYLHMKLKNTDNLGNTYDALHFVLQLQADLTVEWCILDPPLCIYTKIFWCNYASLQSVRILWIWSWLRTVQRLCRDPLILALQFMPTFI